MAWPGAKGEQYQDDMEAVTHSEDPKEEVRNAERELKSLARRVPIKNNLFKIIQYSKM